MRCLEAWRAASRRLRRTVLLAVGMGPLAIGPGVAAAYGQEQGPVQEPVLSPRLSQVLASAVAPDSLEVVVEYRDGPQPTGVFQLQRRAAELMTPLDDVVDQGGVRVRERFWVVPAASVVATAAGIARLAAQPEVRRVYLDERLPVVLDPVRSVVHVPSFTSQAMQTIGADAVWDQGVTGAGVTVAFFDTGADILNAMLAGRWRGNRTALRASWFDPFRRSTLPQDLIGHGTQVALTAVGALPAGDTLVLPDGTQLVAADGLDVVTGTAPEAEWIAARVFEDFGGDIYTRRSVLLQAFQWAMDPDGVPGTDDAPSVINNSWGIFGAADFDLCSDVLYSAIDAAEAAGIAVLFAAGNGGPDPTSVAFPAARDDAGIRNMAVGATQGSGPVSVADFSARGPSPCGGGIKPELAAPGTVPVIVADGSGRVRSTGFTAQGTSFSVAAATGAVALMRQIAPAATPEQAKRFLMNSAQDLGLAGPDNDTGAGLLDVPAAVQLANPSFASVSLQVAVARTSVDSVWVELMNRGSGTWPGGRLELQTGQRTAVTQIGPLAASGRLEIATDRPGSGAGVLSATLFNLGGAAVFNRALLLAPPDFFGGFVLTAGGLQAGANDFGRLGQIAASSGFRWAGTELLTAGSIFVAGGGLISDGIYNTVLDRPGLKSGPAAAETDWAPSRGITDVQTTSAQAQFDDFEALSPLGVQIDALYEVTESAGVGALEITLSVQNQRGTRIADLTPGLFADWDLGGDALAWNSAAEAMAAQAAAGGGPVTLIASDQAVLGFADVPLGTSSGLFYDVGSGVLQGDFTDAIKLALARGGGTAGLPGDGSANDRAAMLSVGPFDLQPGENALLRFWLLVADTEQAALDRLAELRATDIEPPVTGGQFQVLAPFPNPLRIGSGPITFPYSLPASERGAGSELLFEIYDLAGRLMVRERIATDPGVQLRTPTWDGRLAEGREAAAGVYMYVFRFEGQTQSGKLLLLR
ncbi:MAG: S8 family serine peptidase [Gemmatimonadota bacterium]